MILKVIINELSIKSEKVVDNSAADLIHQILDKLKILRD